MVLHVLGWLRTERKSFVLFSSFFVLVLACRSIKSLLSWLILLLLLSCMPFHRGGLSYFCLVLIFLIPPSSCSSCWLRRALRISYLPLSYSVGVIYLRGGLSHLPLAFLFSSLPWCYFREGFIVFCFACC